MNIGFSLVLGAALAAGFGSVVGFASGRRPTDLGRRFLVGAALLYACSMFMANASMVYALVTHDFSVKYVAQVGSRATPLVFTIVSLWSALEGSILFWGLILGAFVGAFAWIHRFDRARFVDYGLGVMLAVGAFFAFIIAGPANPFAVMSPIPMDGPGPNPLLQNHVLMIIHPPMLYLGYVGMTVPFGVAAGALLAGDIDESWMRPLRRWTLVAWAFLSIGITLGAWWAYAVLGWGGYWSWDPVENASFLPWLTATAFIHATIVHERRRLLKAWTLSLALVTFILTQLGTFMTRSGVFNSVHSFTQSDIGPLFLGFIVVVLSFCVVLLALRSHLLESESRLAATVSRDTAFFLNNLVFVALTFTVLIGTLYPLIAEALRGVKVSVGEPYFNSFAVPLGVAMLFLMGLGPSLPWGAAGWSVVKKQLLVPVMGAITALVVALGQDLSGVWPLLTFSMAGFVFAVTLREMFHPAWVRSKSKGENFGRAFLFTLQTSRRRVGGYIVHLGVVVAFVAIAASSSYATHTQATLSVGESFVVQNYRVELLGTERGKEPHREFLAAKLRVQGQSGEPELLNPRINFYERSTDPIGTPAVWSLPQGDVYLSLLAYSKENNTATLNAWFFPLVGWLWMLIPLFAIGTLIAIWPQRERMAP